ncbi:MAG: hypothetical protein HFF01_05675 [Erysipelotrichaceae bacterium]|nr:hypothetical protein [Erysipelotrichaceae bacterium]MCI9524529.1 hypothetical protein [Erysipelotrichaceae bacterium]
MEECPKTVEDVYDFLIQNGFVSEEALCLFTNVHGWNMETMNDVIEATTGYRSMEQLWEEWIAE